MAISLHMVHLEKLGGSAYREHFRQLKEGSGNSISLYRSSVRGTCSRSPFLGTLKDT